MRIIGYDLSGVEIFSVDTHQHAADRAADNLPCVTYDTLPGVVWPFTRWAAPSEGGCVIAIGTPFSSFPKVAK